MQAGGQAGHAQGEGHAWVDAMRAGDFERAWALADRHLDEVRRSGLPKHAGPRHQQCIWRGEQLSGRRVLVRCYHGLGDTIQFARFLRPLRALAAEVTLWCQPELLALMQQVAGVDHALPLHDGAPEVAFDVDIEIMELAHALRAGRDLIEMREPYLTPPADRSLEPLSPEKFSVGLVWGAGDWDKRRAVPAQLLKRLELEGVRLYSLQRGPAAAAAAAIGAEDMSTPHIGELALRLTRLDLIVSVDTMVAHLAGALGCPTWVLLHADCDWRRPQSAGTSPWYPSMRFFHQQQAGNWTGVIEQVRAALVSHLGANSISRCEPSL